jgi:Fuc2NAc and GlcNAc transferase
VNPGLWAAVATTWLAALLLTAGVRRYALHRQILDIPNARSSHSVPTPRGGGLAIVCAVLPALVWCWSRGWITGDFLLAAAGGGFMTAGIGWLDDHRPVAASVRLVVHFAAAAWAVFWLGGLTFLRAGGLIITLAPAGEVLAALLIVWLLNLYNFMDGVDGLAAAEAVTVCLGAALLAVLAGAPHIVAVTLLLAAASAGFLVWNWAPASIFLGDVGSGFLGYMLAVTALYSERSNGPSLLLWSVLLAVFLSDATVTLLRRAVRREPVFMAHRMHTYQRAVQAGLSHARVAAAVVLTNLLLLGFALLAQADTRLTPASVGAAALLLAWLYQTVERRQPM